jgi:hypothetical protein
MKKSELQTMVVSELKALARKMKLKVQTSAKKSDIVALLAAAFKQKNNKPAVIKNNNTVKTAGATKNSTPARTVNAGRKPASKPLPEVKPSVAKPSVEVPPTGREWKVPPGTEEPLMAQERVSDAKYYTGPGTGQAAGAYVELPAAYGEEKIALMVRDPHLAYVYWEIPQSRVEREKAWFGWNGKLTVRLYDITGVQFDGRNAAGYYDQEVSELVGSWYFDLGRPTHSFIADIGLLSPEGRYLTLARSNYVMMPREGVSDVVDEEWMLADEEFWKLYGFPGGPSSPHLQEIMRIRRMQQQITSPGISSRERPKK